MGRARRMSMRFYSGMTVQDRPAATGAEQAARSPDAPRRQWRRVLLFGPAALFLGLLIAFVIGLGRDPNILPSPLIGKPVPAFSLPPVTGRALGLASSDLRGEVSLVNVFASWCVACREEHQLLMRLKVQTTIPLHGLNYKDKPDDAARWLDSRGDPYTRTGADLDGRVAIDWGVYGVPETFVIDPMGRIAFKQVGPLTPEILDQTILPLIAALRADPFGGTGSIGEQRR
jgi:cytochrome c biogenesis protein CcmG/thiol:disulfide interchange protein DsbE